MVLVGSTAEFESARQKLLDGLLACLRKRFQDLDTNDVVQASKLAALQTWPARGENLKGNFML